MSNFFCFVLVLCLLVALVGCKHEEVKIPEDATTEQIIALQVAKKQI